MTTAASSLLEYRFAATTLAILRPADHVTLAFPNAIDVCVLRHSENDGSLCHAQLCCNPAGESRKAATPASSAGSPKRPSGIWAIAPCRAGRASRTLGVAATVDAQPATYPPRRFGQLQNLSVPDTFDDFITDAETAAWEGDSSAYADNSHVFADYRNVYG